MNETSSKDLSSLSDGTLLASFEEGGAAERGDVASELMRRYLQQLYTHVRAIVPVEEAQDVIHEVFVDLFLKLPSLSKKLPDGEAFRSYLFHIARQKALYRSKQLPADRNELANSDHLAWLAQEQKDVEKEFVKAEQYLESSEQLQEILKDLPPDEFVVIKFITEGYTPKEIASKLDITPMKVYHLMSQAKKRLQTLTSA
jgi:RNA polymerase sigma factor (sigma-70 family)